MPAHHPTMTTMLAAERRGDFEAAATRARLVRETRAARSTRLGPHIGRLGFFTRHHDAPRRRPAVA